MKQIIVKDFDILLLHHHEANATVPIRQYFHPHYKFKWDNYPYSGTFTPSITLIMGKDLDPAPDYGDYKDMYVAFSAKGDFNLDAVDRKLVTNDFLACLVEIGKKTAEFTLHNKEKFSLIPVDGFYPQLSQDVYTDLDDFVKTLYQEK
jgi:hypothetical protein